MRRVAREKVLAASLCLDADYQALRTFAESIGDLLVPGVDTEAHDALPLVGHNVIRFDMPFLEAAYRRFRFAPPSHYRYRDTAAIYKARKLGMVQQPNQSAASFATMVLARRVPGLRYSLAHCCAELGIRTDDVRAHRAAGDAVVTQRLYAALTAEAVSA